MKRLRSIAISLIVIICMLIPNITFAYNDYCYLSEDGQHDFTNAKSMSISHPHKGRMICFCGEEVYSDHLYDENCEDCRRELCKKGIHYYLEEVHYNNYTEYTGYGKCYCGKTKIITYDIEELEEQPYYGFLSLFNSFYSAKHPHYEYDVYTGSFYKEDLEPLESVLNCGCCGECKIMNEYYRNIQKYEIDSVLYNEVYDEHEEELYYEDNYHEEDYYEYEEYLGYEEDKDDEEFYSWLELVKEILNN